MTQKKICKNNQNQTVLFQRGIIKFGPSEACMADYRSALVQNSDQDDPTVLPTPKTSYYRVESKGGLVGVATHFLIPYEARAKIIGRGGKNLALLKKMAGIQDVLLSKGTLRIIATDEEALGQACTHIWEMVHKAVLLNFKEKSPFHSSLVVPEDRIKHVIGKGGANLKALENQAGIMFVGLNRNINNEMVLKFGGVNQVAVVAAMRVALTLVYPPDRFRV
jgi:hypothetical protein